MFTVGVVFCIMVYYLFNIYVKPYLHKRFVKPIDDDNKRIVYDDWVERIENCNDPELLHQWQFEDHGKETDIWESGIGYDDALWYMCHDRRMEVFAEQADKKVEQNINNKSWLIEG